MAQREILTVGAPVLRRRCNPIGQITPKVCELVVDLLDTVDDPERAGVSANQIGIPLRAFSWNVDGELGYLLNPVITWRSSVTEDAEEGCLSVPDLFYPLVRAAEVRVEGNDLAGESVVVEADGLLARCIQHEVDHLDGHLYLDRLDVEWRKEAFRDIRELNMAS